MPPYRPDINSIEQVFAKLKHFLPKAKERNPDATWRRAGTTLPTFTPTERSNNFINAGYGSV